MNGEIRIWDVRAPEKPLYESLAQPHGLAGLAVHTGAPILATYVILPHFYHSLCDVGREMSSNIGLYHSRS